MDRFYPYKRRIARIFQSQGKADSEIELVLQKYEEDLDDYLVILYSKNYLGINFAEAQVIEYETVFEAIEKKYSLDYSVADSLKDVDLHSVNRLLIESIDEKEHRELGVQNLSTELKWLQFDEIAEDYVELRAKKGEYYEKYKGREEEFFDLLTEKYPKKMVKDQVVFKSKLNELFSKFRPLQLDQIDSLLEEYRGDEEELIQSLKTKFEQEKTKTLETGNITQENRDNQANREEKDRIEKEGNLKKEKELNEEVLAIERARLIEEENRRKQELLETQAREKERLEEKELITQKEEAERKEIERQQQIKRQEQFQAEEKSAKDKIAEEQKYLAEKAILEKQSTVVKTEPLTKPNVAPAQIEKAIWNGLSVPVINAATLKKANASASEISEELPDYQGRKIFKWEGRIYPYKIVNNPKQKAKKSTLKLSKTTMYIAILVLAISIVGGGGYFAIGCFNISIPFISDSNESSNDTEQESATSIKEDLSEVELDNDKQEEISEDAIEKENVDSLKNEVSEDVESELADNQNEVAEEISFQSEQKDVVVQEEKEQEQKQVQREKITKKEEDVVSSLDLKFHLIAGSFSSESNAKGLESKLNEQGYKARYLGKVGDFYKVSYQSFNSRADAETKKKELSEKGVSTWIQEYQL